MMTASVLFSLLLHLISPAADAAAANKPTCSVRELKRQDCLLKIGSYQVRLLKETIARDDGTWHMVDDMPLKGDGVNWEKIKFEIFKGWPVLQLWLWDVGQGEAKVQSLRWYVADARQREMKILAEGVVRRRRIREASPKPIYDAEEKHSLKVNKNGDLEWVLGREKKTLEKGSH